MSAFPLLSCVCECEWLARTISINFFLLTLIEEGRGLRAQYKNLVNVLIHLLSVGSTSASVIAGPQ